MFVQGMEYDIRALIQAVWGHREAGLCCFLSWIMERKSRIPSLLQLCSCLFQCYK